MDEHEAHDLATLAVRIFDRRWEDPVPLMEQMEARVDDVGRAVELLVASDQGERAARLVGSLLGFWQARGLVDKGREVTERALEDAGAAASSPEWGRAHLVAGVLAFRQGDQDASMRATRLAVAIATATGDVALQAEAETNLARISFRDGAADRMFLHASRVLELAASDVRLKTSAVHMLGWAEYTAGNIDAAMSRFEENAALYRALGDSIGEAMEFANLADLALELGDLSVARQYLEAAFISPEIVNSAYLAASMVRSAGALAGLCGDQVAALRLIAASESMYQSAGLTPDPGDEITPKIRQEAVASLGAERAEEAIRQGESLTPAAAIEAASATLVDGC